MELFRVLVRRTEKTNTRSTIAAFESSLSLSARTHELWEHNPVCAPPLLDGQVSSINYSGVIDTALDVPTWQHMCGPYMWNSLRRVRVCVLL